MSKINICGVIIGGVVAGIIIDAFEYVLNGIVMAPQWTEIMKSLNRPDFSPQAIIWFNIIGLVTGIAAVWTYAAIRPRFGAGPRTAVVAALLTWVTAYVLAMAAPLASGMFPLHPVAIILAAEIVEIIVATLAGAWLYKEAAA